MFPPVHVDDDAKEALNFRHVQTAFRDLSRTIAEQSGTRPESSYFPRSGLLSTVQHCQIGINSIAA